MIQRQKQLTAGAPPRNLRQGRSLAPDVRSRRSLRVETLGFMQKAPPRCQLGAQQVEIESGERFLPAPKISQSTFQYRVRAHKIARRLMMKSDCQLHHPLEMLPQRQVKRHFTPSIFEGLVSVEKTRLIKQFDAAIEVPIMVR